jgi:cytochrome P450 family 142 subfamily A polypeptide 1
MEIDCDFVKADSWAETGMDERMKWLRENDPVFWSERTGLWIIAGYRDLEFISKPGTDIMASFIDEGEPRHGILRKMINRGFTPRMVKKLEVVFRQITTEAIDQVAGKGECDFVESISVPLPILLIAEMIGIRREDHRRFHRWSDDLIATEGNHDDPEIMAKAAQAFVEYGRYVTELIEERREDPRDDLMSILTGAKDDGFLVKEIGNEALLEDQSVEHGELANDELVMLLVVLMIAGNETTRNGISGGMQLLIENPGERQKLIDDPSLLRGAVEEMVRLVSPVRTMGRTLTRDYEFRGKQMKKGQEVCLVYPSANRDAEIYDDPDTFRVERNPQHLGFGIGSHFCLGAYSRGGPEFRPSSLVRSCTHMWVSYTPEN